LGTCPQHFTVRCNPNKFDADSKNVHCFGSVKNKSTPLRAQLSLFNQDD